MGPSGRRPSHPSAGGQITPTSGLVNRRASHLLRSLVPLPQSCEGPSGCNGAAGLGLQCEGAPPQCNGGLFAQGLADPQGPRGGRQLACPPLASGGLALEGVTCGEAGLPTGGPEFSRIAHPPTFAVETYQRALVSDCGREN